MTFDDCELAVLRHVVDESEDLAARKIVNNEDIKRIIKIVEEFIVKKRLVCYGGTAINNILPKNAQFYDKDVEIPDYDFYSPTALKHAKELADIYADHGYLEVEAKAGVHYGTFKVFVNFIPIADITMLEKPIFESLIKDAIIIDGIRYAPADFLRMNVFKELSRPLGDVSRWEKVLSRLTLLNRYHPMKTDNGCDKIDFQRDLDSNRGFSEKIYYITRDSFIKQGVIFFGGYATSLYSKYMEKDKRHKLSKIPDFDVLSEDPGLTAETVKRDLMAAGF
jgi:hypothetical protein